jgi:acyl-CoA reductase-like NAD-dependent aldehyde dehydrogenase
VGSIENAAVAAATLTLNDSLARQREAFARDPQPSRQERQRRLLLLERLLRDNIDALAAAIDQDFGHRSRDETRLLEIFPSLESIKHARRHLGRWMRDEQRPVSLWFQPGRAKVVLQPLGVVGIIAPWNYPILLAAAPLAAALAAGNRAMVKMSEYTPRTARLFADLIARHFTAEELTVVEGDAKVAQAFALLPFNHLLFTGSTKVGHSVMRAAAENLTPVTLELGGKSPAIVGPDYPIDHAAERILVGKTMNAGQTCIAPDHVLLPAGKTAAFLDAARAVVNRCYPDMARTPDYTAIIDQRHFARLSGYLDDAVDKGAGVVPLSNSLAAPDGVSRRIPPLALTGVREDMQVMQDEIFGPLLPIIEYATLDDAIAHVNARPRPLALYYFERDGDRVNRVLRETIAGGVTINDTILHIAQDHLPFGGVGHSGMGHYHGREGFETFSKKKAVFVQSRVNAISLFNPPYGRLFDALVRFLIR